MKTRNKSSALRDKTPGNTPKRERHASDKDFLSSAKKTFAARSIHGRRVDTDEVLPRNFLTSQTSLISPTPVQPPVESTPITLRHHRARLSTTVMRPSMKVPFSPLPPSSPPSSDGEGDEDLPALPSLQSRVELEERVHPEDEEVDENKENEEHEVQHLSDILGEEDVDENAPNDDPFGFFAVERDLKVRREMRSRGSLVPESKGKEVARGRAPFKELAFDPSASPRTSRATPRRPPTPYHPSDDLRESDGLRAPASDDLDDMYLDPTTPTAAAADITHLETADRSVGRLQLRREMEAEENAEPDVLPSEVPPEHATPALSEPPTPRPQHVANISPLPSPFSSVDGTPSKDYSLPSSPSPTKRPSAAIRKAPATVKITGRKSTWGDRFKAVTASAPPAKRARKHATVAKENASEDPAMSTSALIDRLPRRPARRTAKATAKPSAPTRAASSRKAAPAPKRTTQDKGKQRAEEFEDEAEAESVGYVSDSAEESPDETPLASRKRKAMSKAKRPAKRAKVEVVLPTRRSLRQSKPQSTTVAQAQRKGKGRAAPPSTSVARLPDEDSDEARARQARIEYFKALDGYSMKKENVYVV